jgi:hypothetical protein
VSSEAQDEKEKHTAGGRAEGASGQFGARHWKRFRSMASQRNKYLRRAETLLAENKVPGITDVVAVIDLDSELGWSETGLLHSLGCFGTAALEVGSADRSDDRNGVPWDALGAHGLTFNCKGSFGSLCAPVEARLPSSYRDGPHAKVRSAYHASRLGPVRMYDSIAFKGLHGGGANANETTMFRTLEHHAMGMVLPVDTHPLKVASTFGGLMLYRANAISGLRYTWHDHSMANECEHVGLHKAMVSRGADQIYLCPAMIYVHGGLTVKDASTQERDAGGDNWWTKMKHISGGVPLDVAQCTENLLLLKQTLDMFSLRFW